MPVQYIYTSTPPIGRTDCREPQCIGSIAIKILLYGPSGLYSASVPVQCSYNSAPPIDIGDSTEPQYLYRIAVLLLPLWTVRPVESLSACTVEL